MLTCKTFAKQKDWRFNKAAMNHPIRIRMSVLGVPDHYLTYQKEFNAQTEISK